MLILIFITLIKISPQLIWDLLKTFHLKLPYNVTFHPKLKGIISSKTSQIEPAHPTLIEMTKNMRQKKVNENWEGKSWENNIMKPFGRGRVEALKNCCPATITIAMGSARINLFCTVIVVVVPYIFLSFFFCLCIFCCCVFLGPNAADSAANVSVDVDVVTLFASYYVRNLSRVFFSVPVCVCVGRIFRKRKIMNIYPATIHRYSLR